MSPRRRIIFMGTPDFSVPVLQALAVHHDIVAVYTQPARPAGRGQSSRPTAVQVAAEVLGLQVHSPRTLRSTDAQAEFASFNAELAVVVAYGLILPQAILEMPTWGCLNIHASLLPRWRGAAPIHRAIMSGDAKTGICIMQMEAGLDTGPVLMRDETLIGGSETTADLHDRLSAMGAGLIVQAVDRLETLVPVRQSDKGVTYATKIDKTEARVDWNVSALIVDRQIRGLSPFPGAWCLAGRERLKLLRSRQVAMSGLPGELLTGGLVIACGEGAIQVTLAQREGKRPLEGAVVLQSLDLKPGAFLL